MEKAPSFATTAEERIDQVRRAGIAAALAAIVEDRDRDQAGATMLASVFAQARLAGLGI